MYEQAIAGGPTDTRLRQRWSFRYVPVEEWRSDEAPFDDGIDYAALPVCAGSVRVLNREGSAISLGGLELPPGVWREVPVSALRASTPRHNLRTDLSGLASQLPGRTPEGRPVFDWWCEVNAHRGYARQGLDLWRGLRRLGAVAELHASPYWDTADDRDLEPGIVEEARRRKSPSRVAVTMSYPADPAMTENPSPVKIAITQTETSRMPRGLVERVNRCAHLLVTSSFQADVWGESGVAIPLTVLRWGIDVDRFPVAERAADGLFKVLLLGALTPRKNADAAVRIFQRASEDDPAWSLTVKARGKVSYAVKHAARTDPRVRLERGDAPDERVLELYHGHNCLLWPSKGEGVGLPPLEAMSTGMELVCSYNSGMMDYLGDGWAWPIRTARTLPADAPGEEFGADFSARFGSPGEYWLPDEDDAVRQLRECHAAWRQGRGRGRAAAEYVRREHRLDVLADTVLSVIERYV
jgi:glycosyltransferase involved in cell wall biosynthesis